MSGVTTKYYASNEGGYGPAPPWVLFGVVHLHGLSILQLIPRASFENVLYRHYGVTVSTLYCTRPHFTNILLRLISRTCPRFAGIENSCRSLERRYADACAPSRAYYLHCLTFALLPKSFDRWLSIVYQSHRLIRSRECIAPEFCCSVVQALLVKRLPQKWRSKLEELRSQNKKI